MCFHPCVSLSNGGVCSEICWDEVAVCGGAAGLRSGSFSDLNSACRGVFVRVKVLQFHDMLNENHFLDTFRGHSKRTVRSLCALLKIV